LAALPQARRVDEDDRLAVDHAAHVDGVARRPGHGAHDHALRAEERVHEARLAGVPPPDDRDAELARLSAGARLALAGLDLHEGRVDPIEEVLATRALAGRDRDRLPGAE